jgi:2-polyprenyl-6-methoxyphenol hydroxylase-like FAD-dependent oxidoreductase
VRTAVVVGAGVAGLAAAGSLAKAGWQVTLVERGERLRAPGAAQVLWPNAIAALEALGCNVGDLAHPSPSGGIRRPDGRVLVEPARPLEQAVRQEQAVRPQQPAAAYLAAAGDAVPAIRPAVTDSPIPTVPDPAGVITGPVVPAPEAAVIHADDLHDMLMAGLGGRIEIRTGTEVIGIVGGEDWPAVRTARHTLRADLVVAADGAESVMRRRLAPGTEVAPAGYTAWRALVPWFRAPTLPGDVPPAGELLGAGMRFCHATLGGRWSGGEQVRGGIYWWATVPGAPRPEPITVQLGLLRRWFAQWHSPAAELLEATQAGDLLPQAAVHLAPVPERFGVRIGGGGVVMIGDAAHAITPSLTQGAGLALEDAVVLGALMRTAVPGEDLAARLDEFTRLRRDRVVRVDRAARRLDRVVQAQNRLAVAARDALLARLATRLVDPAAAAPREFLSTVSPV